MWCETAESNHAEGEEITLPNSPRTAILNGAVPKSRIEAARETRGRKMLVKPWEESIFLGGGGFVSETAWQASHRFRRFRLYQF